MHTHIRSLEHRAEQLAIRLEELAEQPDVTRIAMAGIFVAIALCWFAVAWGEGLLLLALPIVAAGCVLAVRSRQAGHDPAAAEDHVELGRAGQEIDQWLTKVTSGPARPEPQPASNLAEPEPLRIAFQAPAPSLDARLAPAPPLSSEDSPLQAEAAAEVNEAIEAEPEPEPVVTTLYEVCEIRAGGRVLLEVRSTFDGAVDVAFELIDERDPAELEIVLVRGHEREKAWSYSRDAAEGRPRGTLDLFGFDATRWTQARR